MKNLNFNWLKAGLLSLSVLVAGISGQVNAQTNPCNLKPEFTAKVECRTVVFSGFVNQQGASYSWTFGDGSYSSDKTVKKTYWKDGVYNVCLTVAYKGTDGKMCKITVCKEVKVGCPGNTDCKLQGGFNFNVDKNGNAKFQAYSNEGFYYYWSFGDGSSGTGKDIYHYYKKPGKYEVCLTIVSKNQKCKIRICKTVVIENRCNVMGDFSWKIDSLGNLRVEGQSNTGVSYEWMLPGSNTAKWGKVQELKLPKCGIYEICVKIYSKDKRCFVTVCKKIEWKCPCNLMPYFNTQVNPNKPLSIYFAGGSTGGYTYTWNYGDGTSGTGQQANHTYAKAGTYKVCLLVCDQVKKCCQEICKTITVSGGNSEPCLAKLANWSSTVDCKTRTMTYEGFLNGMTGYGPCVKFAWSFGDGTYSSIRTGKKTFAKAGTYNVCLKVIDSCRKCDTTICRKVVVEDCACKLPTGWSYGKVSGTTGTYQFEGFMVQDSNYNQGCLKYTWTWGDGTSSTGRLPKKEYKQNGTYTVCMKVIDTCKKCDTSICKSITVTNCNTQAYFIIDSIVNGKVYFRNMSANAVYYYWSFGDSTFSADKTPSKTYLKSGTYTVCLTAWDQTKSCSTKVCKTITVTRRSGSNTTAEILPVYSEVYPNPASTSVNVRWSGMTGTKVQITDLNGRVLSTQVAAADQSSLAFNISGLPQGIYLVKLSDGKTTQVKRFVKNQ